MKSVLIYQTLNIFNPRLGELIEPSSIYYPKPEARTLSSLVEWIVPNETIKHVLSALLLFS